LIINELQFRKNSDIEVLNSKENFHFF